MIVLCVLFFLICAPRQSFSQIKNPCPPDYLITPCDCRKEGGSTVVKCNGLQSTGQLEMLFQKVPGWKFNSLKIKNSTMMYVPASLFKTSAFENMVIKRSHLVSIFDKPPTSALSCVAIRKSVIQRGIQWGLLSKLNLTSLIIEETTVRRLTSTFGDTLPKSLLVIFMRETGLTHIHPESIAKLENLKIIGINNGNLRKLDKILFPKSIINIQLNHDQIEYIPDGMFNGLPNLEIISLSYNLLPTIKRRVFRKVPFVYMDENPIDCDCRIKWIVKSGRQNMFKAKCIAPRFLEGKMISQLKRSDFNYCG